MGQLLNTKADTQADRSKTRKKPLSRAGKNKKTERSVVVQSDKTRGEAVETAGNEQETLIQGGKDEQNKSKVEADCATTTETTNDAAKENLAEENTDSRTVEK